MLADKLTHVSIRMKMFKTLKNCEIKKKNVCNSLNRKYTRYYFLILSFNEFVRDDLQKDSLSNTKAI